MLVVNLVDDHLTLESGAGTYKVSALFRCESMEKAQILIYSSRLYRIGGIETFLDHFTEYMSESYDIALMCKEIPAELKVKLSKKIRVYDVQPFKCEILLMLRFIDPIPDVEHGKVIRMCHACKTHPEWNLKDYDELINVSEESKRSFETDGKVIHNLIKISDNKSLLLVSATRIPAKDKGENTERILKLAKMLEDNGISFLWLNFSNGEVKDAPKGFINVGRYDEVQSYIRKADYLVQLSDSEAWSYSVLEALVNKVPVIVTPFPTVKEMGIVDGKNGYIIPFDLDFDVNKLLEIPKFDYEYDNDKLIKAWKKVLGESKKKSKPMNLVLLKVLKPYSDSVLNRTVCAGEIITTTKERAELIISHGYGVEQRTAGAIL